jgi:hypothetical protein
MPILRQVPAKRTYAPYENYCVFISELLIPVMATLIALLHLLLPSLHYDYDYYYHHHYYYYYHHHHYYYYYY